MDLVFIPGYVSNVEFYWEAATGTRLFERLASFARVVLWDKRGTGLSDPVDRVPTLDERTDDLMAVMDAVGVERAAFFGVSEGGPMGLLFAAAHPERTTALALYGASPKFSSSSDWEWGWSPDEIRQRLAEIERDWGEGALLSLFAPSQVSNEAMRHGWGQYQRRGGSPALGRAVFEALCEIDCRKSSPPSGSPRWSSIRWVIVWRRWKRRAIWPNGFPGRRWLSFLQRTTS
jgi:pimeloyl-ACP methyl ester carboxylesterase